MGRGGPRWQRLPVFSAKGRWVVWRERLRGRAEVEAKRPNSLSFRKSPALCTAGAHMPNTTASPKTPSREGLAALDRSRRFSSLGRQLPGREEMARCE